MPAGVNTVENRDGELSLASDDEEEMLAGAGLRRGPAPGGSDAHHNTTATQRHGVSFHDESAEMALARSTDRGGISNPNPNTDGDGGAFKRASSFPGERHGSVDTAVAVTISNNVGDGSTLSGDGDDDDAVFAGFDPNRQRRRSSAHGSLNKYKHGGGTTSETDSTYTGGSVSGSTTNASGKAARASGNTTIRCAGFKVRVPFTAWTFLAMLVPIVLLVAVLSIGLAATVTELGLVEEHKALATAVGECSSWLMRERGTMGPWIARGSDTDWANLQRVRAGVDAHCGDGLAGEMRKLSAESTAWAVEIRRHVRLLQNLATWRERVNTRVVDGRAARGFFTASIAESAESLIIVVDMLQLTERAFSELRLTIGARNYIGLARGVGNAIAASDPNATTGSSAVVHEYIAGHAQARLGYAFLRGMAAPALRAKLSGWEQSDAAARMWGLLDTMADVSGGGVLAIQQNNATEWWAVVSAGLDALYAVEQAHLAELHRATAAKASVRDSALIMVFGVAVCLAAAGLLAWRQTQVRRQLEDQVARVQKTKKAVSAFVPRFFLQKMGYTSITQVRAGESTNVALAMLFSDIRRFTTVSEGMESTELFDWVQGYFQRMTTIVEGRRGNVNQFVGDAMFAVFGTCNDALECAVDMQADVQQLNVQRLCADSSIIPIEVGVGIHHDVVALGILGDSKRHTCTAISASVNLASRLEGLTKQLGCKIIASEAVVGQLSAAEASRLRLRRLGPAVVKGAIAAAVIYDVYQTDERALQQYKAATEADVAALIDAILDGSAPEDTGRILATASEASVGKPWHSFSAAHQDTRASSVASSAEHPPTATGNHDGSDSSFALPNAPLPTVPSPRETPATPHEHPAEHPPDETSASRGAAFVLAHITAGRSVAPRADSVITIDPRVARICAAFAKYGVTDVPLLTIASMSHNHGSLQFMSK